MSSATQLLAMGNPLLDMQISTDQKMLDKYGLKANDAVLVNDTQKGMRMVHGILESQDFTKIPGIRVESSDSARYGTGP
ncbi:hypothetical protein PCANC_15006 [Puccinia coronata f. sp. avenae]|uniref:Adenosine kinase n=1 Tax=Puccinia coronata f. sp. avenae TaxID=200324 RepID=A0A2N5STK7_9BASI|nr:hypothetical protein PCANC_15006 [Puccinia coronata f. sp. avenae]